MKDQQASWQAAADRLSAKLQAFYEALPEAEKQVMTYLIRHMAIGTGTSGRQMDARIVFDMPEDPGPAR